MMQTRPKPPEDLEMGMPEEKSSIKFSGMTTYIVTAVIAIVAAIGVTLLFGVTKSDFTKNMVNVASDVESMKSDLKASRDSINTAINNTFPNTVDNKVSNAVSSINGRITTLENGIQSAKDNSLTASNKSAEASKQSLDAFNMSSANRQSLADMTAQITSIKTDIKSLQDTVGSNANLTALTSKVSTLETQVATLQNQYTLSTVLVNTGLVTYTVYSGVAINVPVALTNTGTTNIVVPMRLTLSTSGLVTVTNAVMDRTSTQVVSGSTVTYFVNISVPANSSITSLQAITLNYTGSSPNAWSASWTKQ